MVTAMGSHPQHRNGPPAPYCDPTGMQESHESNKGNGPLLRPPPLASTSMYVNPSGPAWAPQTGRGDSPGGGWTDATTNLGDILRWFNRLLCEGRSL